MAALLAAGALVNRGRERLVVLAGLVVAMTLFVTNSLAEAADTVPGSQGTDTSLPATPSQITVSGRDAFANLAITVNQTQNLTNQAVSITWTGGEPTRQGPGRFGSRFLQIMQCWGDDDGTVPANPGPPPEQCEQGAVGGSYGGLPGSLYPAGFALSRVISRSDWPNYDPAVGTLDTRTTNVWLPFRAVDGTTVGIQTDPTFNPAIIGGNFWLNPYYNQITTNEIAGAATGPDGEGAELFEVLTGVQSSGLGCGQASQPDSDGTKKVPQCWIVVVPRGDPADENAGTPFASEANQSGVVTSPVSPSVWKNRIAIPISFNPVDSPCTLGADERRISGSELFLPAIASWQPSLCANGGLSPFSYAPVSDSSARQQLVSGQPGSPGMVVVSKPLSADVSSNPDNPVVYAPLSASGLVIGFNIERNPSLDAPPAEQALAGIRVADLNLTPRLVAKLLTQSYRQAVTIEQAPNYPWLASNPAHLGLDPDFKRFNPEFDLLQIADSRTFSGLQLPAGNSDAAQQIWSWVLADPEARAWLDGQPDEWGMVVNPVYATTDAANSTGAAFGTPVPTSFPKSDPYCYQAPARGVNGSIVPPPLCGTDWMPYSRGFADAAKITRSASDGARIVDNPFAISSSQVWTREQPQYLGKRDMLALTDTPSAAQFGLQTARLSRAGDDGATRRFVAADTPGLTAGVAAMAPGSLASVLEANPLAAAPDAYPLTTMTYAALAPLSLDAAARGEYAAFLAYAAGAGQVPGLELGQLPRGYAPLSATLQSQTAQAASTVLTLTKPVDPTTTTTSVPPTTEPATTEPPGTTAPRSNNTSNATPSTSRPRNTSTAAPATPTATPGVEETVDTSVVPAPDSTAVEVTTTTSVETVEDDRPTSSSTPPVLTPVVALAKSRFAVPALGVVALGSALGALELTKRPRRRVAAAIVAAGPEPASPDLSGPDPTDPSLTSPIEI